MAVDSLDSCGIYFGTTGGTGVRVGGRRRHLGGDSRVLAQSVLGGGPDAPVTTVRVALSAHLRTLASVDGEVKLEVADPPTVATVLDALESRYPMP